LRQLPIYRQAAKGLCGGLGTAARGSHLVGLPRYMSNTSWPKRRHSAAAKKVGKLSRP